MKILTHKKIKTVMKRDVMLDAFLSKIELSEQESTKQGLEQQNSCGRMM